MESLLNVLKWSAAVGAVTLLTVAVKPLLDRRFTPKWRYWLWLVLAVGLIFSPVRWETLIPALPEPAVTVTVPEVRVPVSRSAADLVPGTGADKTFSDKAPVEPAPSLPAVLPQTPTAGYQAPAAQPQRTVELSVILTALWLAGAAVFVLWHIIGTALLSRRMRRWSAPTGAEMRTLYNEICREMKLRRAPELRVSRSVTSPMVTGLLRARLWLPDGGTDPRELAMILRHELTHVRRRDLWYKALMLLTNAVHWFNPLIWLMRREASETVELLCDAQAMAGADEAARREYCETLLANIRREKGSALTTHFYGGAKSVKNRFKNLLTGKKRRFGWTALIAGVLAVAVAACAVGLSGGNGWTAELSAYDPGAALGEGFTVEVTGLSTDAPMVYGRGGYNALTKLTVTAEGFRFAFPGGDRGEVGAWSGLLWNAVEVDPVTGEERTEDEIESLSRYLRIFVDGSERTARLERIERPETGETEYVVAFADPLSSHDAESGTLFIVCGAEDWLTVYAPGGVEPWSVELVNDHEYNALFPGFSAAVKWKDGEPVIEQAYCYNVTSPVLSDEGVSFSVTQNVPDEANWDILPIREYAVFDSFRDEDITKERENTPEFRKALEKVFQVRLNGVTVPGRLRVTGGNGHTDFNYIFDKPLARPADGDAVSIYVFAGVDAATDGEPLTAQGLARWQERLNTPDWNGFVAQFYRSPAELDLYELLYLGGVSRGLTEAELAEFGDVDGDILAMDVEAVDRMLTERTGVGLDTVVNGLWKFERTGDALILAHGDTNYTEVSISEGTRVGGTEYLEICHGDDLYMGTLTVRDGKIVSFTNPVYTALAQAQEEYGEMVARTFDNSVRVTDGGAQTPARFEASKLTVEPCDVIMRRGAGTYVIRWDYDLLPGVDVGEDVLNLTDIGVTLQREYYAFRENPLPCTVIEVDESGYVHVLDTLTGTQRGRLGSDENVIAYVTENALPLKTVVDMLYADERSFIVKTTWGGATNARNVVPDYQYFSVDSLLDDLTRYTWTPTQLTAMPEAPDSLTVFLESQDGRYGIRMNADGGPAELISDGVSSFYALSDADRADLWRHLRQTAEYAISETCRIYVAVDGDLSPEGAAQALSEKIAANFRALPEWVGWRPTDFQAKPARVFDEYLGEPRQFCADIGFRLKLADVTGDSPARLYWETGAGLAEPDAQGYSDCGMECLVEKNDNGDWQLVDAGTGGYFVSLPGWNYLAGRPDYIGNAPVEELLWLFTLTRGETHDWRIPMWLAEKTVEDLNSLPKALEALTADQARDLRDKTAAYVSTQETTDSTRFVLDALDEYLGK